MTKIADASLIREKIFAKFRVNPDDWDLYRLYIDSTLVSSTSEYANWTEELLDLDLEKICEDPKNPCRKLIVLDRFRHVNTTNQLSHDNIRSGSTNSLNSLSSIVSYIPKRKKTNHKLVNFFGENIPVNGSPSKLDRFFGGSDKPKKMKGKKSKGPDEGSYDYLPRPSQSKKLESFFGDRPPTNMIAENLENFFPGFNSLQLATNNIIDSKNDEMSSITHVLLGKKDRKSILHQGSTFELSNKRASFISSLSQASTTATTCTSKSTLDLGVLTKRIQSSNLLDVPDEVIPNVYSSDNDIKIRAKSISMITLERDFVTALNQPAEMKWIQGQMIGAGSFAKVYYGANCVTGEIMAVKQVETRGDPSSVKSRKKMLDALHCEVALLSDLVHVNIVRYLGYDIEPGFINVFLEYVSGGSVSSALSLMGPFPETLMRSVTLQVINGIKYLHDRQIIHRDVKGANSKYKLMVVLIDDDGKAKISDFGISKKLQTLAYTRSSVMSLQGSVFWMAPEVIKGKGYSAKVDIWSLGCVVLEMATGDHPWEKVDEFQILWKLGSNRKPPMPETLTTECTELLRACFERYGVFSDNSDPEMRPTASKLLLQPFVITHADSDFNFRVYKEEAIRIKKEKDEMESDEDSNDSEDNDLDDTVNEEEADIDPKVQENSYITERSTVVPDDIEDLLETRLADETSDFNDVEISEHLQDYIGTNESKSFGVLGAEETINAYDDNTESPNSLTEAIEGDTYMLRLISEYSKVKSNADKNTKMKNYKSEDDFLPALPI